MAAHRGDSAVVLRPEEHQGVPITLVLPPELDADRPGGARGVVVVQEAFGVTDHIVDVCRRMARHGYVAAAPHLHHRAGDPPPVASTFAQARPLMDAWTGRGIRADLLSSMEMLREAGCGDFGILGFCAGGSIALWAASTLPFSAAVTFYGGGILASRWEGVPPGLESARELTAPWLGLYGDQDPSIPPEQVEQLAAAVSGAPVPAAVVRYPQAGHAFHNDTRPDHHHPESARDAWARAMAWFDAQLHERLPNTGSVS